jgi:hypothetical protein
LQILNPPFHPTVALPGGVAIKSWSSPGVVLARVEAILSNGGWLQGAADARWVGKAAGY